MSTDLVPTPTRDLRAHLSGDAFTTLVLPGAFVVMVVAFWLSTPTFMTSDNLFVILRQSAVLGVAAVGGTIILISGKLDISQGAIIAATGIGCIELLTRGVPAPIAMVIAVAFGAFLGLCNGFLTEIVKIPGFIATLATALVIRGAAQVYTGGQSKAAPVADGFDLLMWVGIASLGPIPVSVIILLVSYAVAWFVMHRTAWGLRCYAVGSSARASRVAGLRVRAHGIAVFVVAGATSALAGVLLAGRLGSAAPSNGSGAEFDIFAAIVLGGTSLFGGRGSVLRTLLGVLFLATLTNGLVMLNVSSYYQSIATGVVLLLALAADRWRSPSEES